MSFGVASRLGLLAAFVLGLGACAPKPPSCREPAPPNIVDGKVASETDMKSAHDAVVRFQKLSDDYQTCLIEAVEAYKANPPFFSRVYNDGYEADLDARKHRNQLLKEKVVGAFNISVRTYNALHP